MAVIVRKKVKGPGEWWVFINHNKKRKSKKIGSKKIGSKKAANSVAKEIEKRLAKGDMGILKEETPTIAKYGEHKSQMDELGNLAPKCTLYAL